MNTNDLEATILLHGTKEQKDELILIKTALVEFKTKADLNYMETLLKLTKEVEVKD